MINNIIQLAKTQNKNILILASPRSGTHALAAEISSLSGAHNLNEICKTGYCDNPWDDVDKLCSASVLTIAHIVQLTPKITLAENVSKIKNHNIIVNIKRSNVVDQFASWIYFRVLDPTGLHGWHNHTKENTRLKQGSLIATEQDITQFKLEQLVDDFFMPDFRLKYEDLLFENQATFKQNKFAFPIRQIFSNVEYVEQQFKNWQYSEKHFENE
jgi:hypothetical protein